MDYGFVRVASAIPSVKVADVEYNVQQIEILIHEAVEKGVEIIVFPELCVTGYSCQDLFAQRLLIDESENGVRKLLNFSKEIDLTIIVGAPIEIGNALYNCAIVIHQGTINAIVPKTYLPNYGEFYEKRWFASAHELSNRQSKNSENTINYAGVKDICVDGNMQIIETADGIRLGVEVCEDVWAPVPPSSELALAGADIIFNLSASDELTGKHDYLKSLLSQQSARTICGYVYSGCGFGESTQDVVYGGNALIYENGVLLAESKRFSLSPQLVISEIDVERLRGERRRNTTYRMRNGGERQVKSEKIINKKRETSQSDGLLYRTIDPHPFIPADKDMTRSCEEIFNIQVMGLAKRLVHTNSKCVILGISGGLDSTLALLVCIRTFDTLGYDRKGIVGVTMPGFGTSDRTYHNAIALMKQLDITMREISIAKSVTQHFEDIGHDAAVHDITYENSQARERTQILMDLGNQLGGLVIGTGDLSELALGWATYNGDHMSMYGVNAGIPKTLIQYLIRYVAKTWESPEKGKQETGNEKTSASLKNNGQDTESNSPYSTPHPSEILLDIIDTPISPELTPADSQGNIKQKTEDLVGPYELHDFYLYYMLRFGFRPAKIYMLAQHAFCGRYDDATLKKWLTTFCRRFFAQQFKRSCLPDGPKVGSVSLSPRGDWRMPSDASSALWLKECDEL